MKVGCMSTKTCKRCLAKKDLDSFGKVKSCVDGHRNICKYCVNKDQIHKKNTNPERLARHRKYARDSGKRCRDLVKEELLIAYGSRCTCCGETIKEFLTVDHIFNDGAVYRKSKNKRHFYKQLKDLGFPKDRYQLLCWNCNAAKGIYGICPHQTM